MPKKDEKTKVNPLREKIKFYQNHERGVETWMEDHIRIAIPDPYTGQPRWTYLSDLDSTPHPVTRKTYKDFWEWQKVEIIRPSHKKDQYGIYIYHTIVLCTPRGQGKTFMCAFMILYRFFTMPRQKILLGSNSMGQSKFSMYETLQELIRNSPRMLAIVGSENIKEKEIRLINANGDVTNIIRTVSTSTGILSNATCFNFTEFFQQRPDAPFFHQLNSSRRGIVNSHMLVDSTVSSEDHTLRRLYDSSFLRNNTNPGVFFYYDYSEKGDIGDYRLPSMTQVELDGFKDSMPPADFRMLFLNKWEDGGGRLFTPDYLMATKYLGVGGDGVSYNHQELVSVCKKITELESEQDIDNHDEHQDTIDSLRRSLYPLPYRLSEDFLPRMSSEKEVRNLCNMYDSDFAVCVGIDRADPLKDDRTSGARTIVTTTLKFLPGSRSNPNLHLSGQKEDVVKYRYFLGDLAHIESNELDDIKFHLDIIIEQFGRIDTLCSEKWGMSELVKFCEGSEVVFEFVSPTFAVQRASFNALYSLVRLGLFKSPNIVVPGYVKDNILDEELSVFSYDSAKRWYGSPTKKSEKKPQDDSVYSLALGIYGGRELTPLDFSPMPESVPFVGWFPDHSYGAS